MRGRSEEGLWGGWKTVKQRAHESSCTSCEDIQTYSIDSVEEEHVSKAHRCCSHVPTKGYSVYSFNKLPEKASFVTYKHI